MKRRKSRSELSGTQHDQRAGFNHFNACGFQNPVHRRVFGAGVEDDASGFEPDKLPRDVYLRLIECLRSIVRIFDMQGLAVLTIETSRTDLDRVNPGDVYLVAAMIVSQLDFLYQHLGSARPPPQPIYPGLKFPAHSYQRAGILLAQLQQLERHLAPNQAAQPLPEPR